MLDDLSAWGYLDPIQFLDAALTHSSLHTLPLLLMGTEPAVQRIAVPLYQAGARDADLEFEMGAHAMSERNYTEAEQHLARVTEGAHAVQAALLRILAFELLGKLDEARRLSMPSRSSSRPPVTPPPGGGFASLSTAQTARPHRTPAKQAAPSP